MQSAPIRVQMPDGKVAEFPVGTTPEQITKALATVQSSTDRVAGAPFNPPRMSSMREDTFRFTPEEVKTASKHLPMAGAVLGTALTGGAGAPAILAAGGGAAIGQGVKDVQYDGSTKQRVINMVKSGAGAMLAQGTGEALTALAPGMAQGAKNLWKRAAKVPDAVAKQTQTALRGGSLPAAKDEIAETVLAQGTGTINRANMDTMRSGLDALDDMVDAIIAKSKAGVSRSEIEKALLDKAQEIGVGTLGQAKEQAAIDAAFDELQKLPARMSVQKAQSVKRSIYQARNYVADSKDAAEAMADKTMGKAYRRAIAREEPAVGPINDQLTRQIPATKAMELAVNRTGNTNVVGLSQMLAGVVTNPLSVANALINNPKFASFSAQRIHNIAKLLPKANRNIPNIIRALSMFGKDEE